MSETEYTPPKDAVFAPEATPQRAALLKLCEKVDEIKEKQGSEVVQTYYEDYEQRVRVGDSTGDCKEISQKPPDVPAEKAKGVYISLHEMHNRPKPDKPERMRQIMTEFLNFSVNNILNKKDGCSAWLTLESGPGGEFEEIQSKLLGGTTIKITDENVEVHAPTDREPSYRIGVELTPEQITKVNENIETLFSPAEAATQ